eukprot:6219178-Amphidinium_carterae.1
MPFIVSTMVRVTNAETLGTIIANSDLIPCKLQHVLGVFENASSVFGLKEGCSSLEHTAKSKHQCSVEPARWTSLIAGHVLHTFYDLSLDLPSEAASATTSQSSFKAWAHQQHSRDQHLHVQRPLDP